MNYNEYLLKPYINNASDINTFLQDHSLEQLFNRTNYKEIEIDRDKYMSPNWN